VVFEEGLFRSDDGTRLRAVVVGGGGPHLVVGRATARGTEQSALSKKLTPPVKWSYLKVTGWSVLVFLGAGWLVFYVNTVTANATTVSSAPLTGFGLIGGALFVLLIFLVFRHNHAIYQRRFTEWDHSFVCQRCGSVSQFEF
jgi:hypothetical protein